MAQFHIIALAMMWKLGYSLGGRPTSVFVGLLPAGMKLEGDPRVPGRVPTFVGPLPSGINYWKEIRLFCLLICIEKSDVALTNYSITVFLQNTLIHRGSPKSAIHSTDDTILVFYCPLIG